jgi:hypothetical protein
MAADPRSLFLSLGMSQIRLCPQAGLEAGPLRARAAVRRTCGQRQSFPGAERIWDTPRFRKGVPRSPAIRPRCGGSSRSSPKGSELPPKSRATFKDSSSRQISSPLPRAPSPNEGAHKNPMVRTDWDRCTSLIGKRMGGAPEGGRADQFNA